MSIRFTFAGLTASLLYFLLALSFAVPWNDGDAGPYPSLVTAVGVISLGLVQVVRRRQLSILSSEALVTSYRIRSFGGVAFAELPAMAGLVAAFLSRPLWLYMIGLAFSLLGLGLIAPSRLNVAARQAQIDAAGSSLSLGRLVTERFPRAAPGWSRLRAAAGRNVPVRPA